MAIHKTAWFDRWARKESLGDDRLCAAVREMREGLFDADLGSGLYKKRIARAGQGKSGGFRTLLTTNRGDRWIFVYGFPKSERANMDRKESEALKKLATHLLGLSSTDIAQAQREGELIKVNCDEEKKVDHP